VTFKAVLSAPRLCGWRRLDGEIVRDGEGKVVVGKWEPILTPEERLAVQAIIDIRKSELVHNDSVRNPAPAPFGPGARVGVTGAR
jgi:hypothetical protein